MSIPNTFFAPFFKKRLEKYPSEDPTSNMLLLIKNFIIFLLNKKACLFLIRLLIITSYFNQLTIEYLVPFDTAFTLWLYTYVDGKSNN